MAGTWGTAALLVVFGAFKRRVNNLRSLDISAIPWQKPATLEPIAEILHTVDIHNVHSKIQAWRESKLSELTFVGLTSTLITVVFASAFSWNQIDGAHLKYTRGIWYSGLIIALTAATLVTQQGIHLHRLSIRDGANDTLRASFGRQAGSSWKPRRSSVLLWQMPVMLLNLSIFLLVLGLLTYIMTNITSGQESIEVAVLVTIGVSFSVGCYIFATFTLYANIGP